MGSKHIAINSKNLIGMLINSYVKDNYTLICNTVHTIRCLRLNNWDDLKM